MDLCHRNELVDEHMLIRPTHVERRASKNRARNAEHPIDARVGSSNPHIGHWTSSEDFRGGLESSSNDLVIWRGVARLPSVGDFPADAVEAAEAKAELFLDRVRCHADGQSDIHLS